MGRRSDDGGAAGEKVTNSCSHQRQNLYLKPTDIKFLELWHQSNLETWKVQLIAATKLRSRRIDAALGNGAVKIWQNLTDI